MSERIGEVLVDPVGRKVGDAPRQTPEQDLHLAQVGGGSSNAVHIPFGKIGQCHGTCSSVGAAPASREGYSTTRTRSSIGYGRVWKIVLWASQRRWPILRAAWLFTLTALIFLHRTGDALVLVLLGHFREAVRDWLRGD